MVQQTSKPYIRVNHLALEKSEHNEADMGLMGLQYMGIFQALVHIFTTFRWSQEILFQSSVFEPPLQSTH